jgi:CubicO group peptidase (beta-lactamase class C family)
MLRRRRTNDLQIARIGAVAAAVLLMSLHLRQAGPSEDPMIAELDAIFAPLSTPKAPGVAALVKKDGRVLFARGYGVRDLRTFTAIDPQTNFRLASCTKQFTAMAIMLLVHDGKLRYEQTLTEIFPEFPAFGKAITVRHLLNHTSGLQDYEILMDEAKHAGWTEENQIQDADVLTLFENSDLETTIFAPGTKWAYSNSGYVLLGLIAAKVSGKTFGDFLDERIFTPLKMDQTIAYEKGQNEVRTRAFGHTKGADGWKQTDQSSTSATLGDGGVYSSLRDLEKWDEALARHTLLSQDEMRAALTPAQLADRARPEWPADSDRPAGTPVSYGFGWFLDPYQGHPRMWHYGDTMGFHSYIERFAADAAGHGRLTIIVLCNRTDLNPEELAGKAANLFLSAHD